jgi:hypothetical protein
VAEHQVLVELGAVLAVEVDVEELALPQRLADAGDHVEPGHLLVADLGVEADHVGLVQHADEGDGVADARQEDVAAGLVGLGLDGQPHAVPLVLHVLAEQVDALLVPLQRDAHVLAGVGLGALAPAPQDVGGRAQLRGEVHVAHDLAQRVAADVAVGGGEGAVLEDRVGEGVGRHHGHDDAGLLQRGPEPLDAGVALGVGRPERDQVVVVERDAVGTRLREPVHRLDRVQRGAGRVAERVPGLPADRPQAEAELVGGGRGGDGHGGSFASGWWCRAPSPVVQLG